MNPTLQGYTSAILEATGSAGGDVRSTLANELVSIEQLVLASGPLNAALTDTTMRPPVRRAVMLDLLDGKVTAPARRLAAFATSAVRARRFLSHWAGWPPGPAMPQKARPSKSRR